MGNANTLASMRPIITLIGVVVITAALYMARAVLVPFALATLLAFILTPAVSFLQHHHFRRIPSVICVVTIAFSLAGGTGYIVGNQLAGLVGRLPEYKGVISTKIDSITHGEDSGLLHTVRGSVREISRLIATSEQQQPAPQETNVIQDPPRGSTPEQPLYMQVTGSSWNGLADYAGPAVETLASAVLVLVLVVFMLVQREDLRNRVVRLIGHGRLIVTTRAIDEATKRISRFLAMQLMTNVGFGASLSLSLLLVSLFGPTARDAETLRQYALLWGFVCGLLRFVPYLGTWAGAVALFAFTVATLHGWTLPLVIFAVYCVLELIIANAIEPLLFGQSTGTSPLALLLAAAFWAWLWGPVGLLLSTPLTVVLIVIGKYVADLHFLEVLLGDEPVLRPHVVLYQRLVALDLDEASDLVEEYSKGHTLEEMYQELFLQTLLLARQDHDRGELDGESSRELYRSIRDLIDDFTPAPAASADARETEQPVMLGCPARDEVDELALAMFGNLLEARGRTMEVLSSKTLTAEVLEKTNSASPVLVVISCVAPGGVAQARYLCKRLKMQSPGVRLVVGRWGPDEDRTRVLDRLKQSGADFAATSFTEARSEVMALLQVAETGEPKSADQPLAAVSHA